MFTFCIIFVFCQLLLLSPVSIVYMHIYLSVPTKPSQLKMCLQNSIQAELINLKSESLEWTAKDKYDKYEDTCAYLTLENCKEIPHEKTDLCVLQYNIRGLASKQKELQNLLGNCTTSGQVDVVILSETWLTKESEKCININGYEYYGKNRDTKKGGGVGFLIRNTLRYKPRPDLCKNSSPVESCVIEVDKSVLLCSTYRPPNTSAKKFLEYYENLCSTLKLEKIKSHIIGLDHNLDLLKHHLHRDTQQFMELMMDHNQLPCITRPTRIMPTTATLIDNIVVSMNMIDRQYSSIITYDISDHLPSIMLVKGLLTGECNTSTTVKRQMTQKRLDSLTNKLINTEWYDLLHEKNAEDSMTVFHDKLLAYIDTELPEKTVRVSNNRSLRKSWMTKGLLKCSRKQLKLYQNYLSDRSSTSHNKYRNYQRVFQQIK